MAKTKEIAPSPSFEEVYTKYRAYFVAIAVSYVRDRMAAEDLVTDSFLKVWDNREMTQPLHLPAYLLTILRRKCLDWLRDKSIHLRAQQNIQQTEQRVLAERISRLEANDPQQLITSEALAIIERELRKMPELRRRVFIAHRYEDMSYREITEVYQLSENQVNYEIRVARETLKIALKDYLPLAAILMINS